MEHGTILGAVDEIVLTLDDNSMNLQSMSASRYVGPFLEKVQKWEKSLSHISEVVEVWHSYILCMNFSSCEGMHVAMQCEGSSSRASL